MVEWILIVNLIISVSNDEIAPVEPITAYAFNQLMQFKMSMESMEKCWETAANINGATYVLSPTVKIQSRCEKITNKESTSE